MSELAVLQLSAAVVGVGLALLCSTSRRLGPASGFLAAFLVPASLSAAVLSTNELLNGRGDPESLRIPFVLLLLSAPGGLLFAVTLTRANHRQALRKRGWILATICLLAPLLSASLFMSLAGDDDDLAVPEGYLILGHAGYACALYLLAVSVLILASLERMMRSAEDHVRWEIKFVVLGIYASFATLTYLASRMLLYSPGACALSGDAVRVFPIIFLVACLLTVVSWHRSSGQSRVVVSQGVIYGSISFLGIGIYLIASSLAAQWAGTLVRGGVEIQAVVFLLFALLFATVLLSTRIRHRIRHWIRKNFFEGRYDYRTFWMEATEKVRASDPVEEAASALADLIIRALGILDVTVWLRSGEPGNLRLLAVRGCAAGPPPKELPGVIEKIEHLSEPFTPNERGGANDVVLDPEFLRKTSASLIVPLRSGGETVGLLTVGSDRSGQSFNWEAGEFLRVLGCHAAGELHKAEMLETLVAAKEAEAFRSFSTFLLHDLKNFASTLSLIAKNAARHQGNPEFQRDAFQSVFDTAEKMKRLCNSLRTFAGAIAVQKQHEDLNRIVRDVAESFDGSLSARLRLDLGELPPVLVDAEEVSRVLQNLLLNAGEATSAQGSVIVRTSRRDGTVELTVEDDGKGISKNFLERELFLPFRTTKSNGLGIGLFQSKKILEAHGGTIGVESEEGKGTRVTASFPLAGAVGSP
jgi:putative PEP-CTERM system histidine kinase